MKDRNLEEIKEIIESGKYEITMRMSREFKEIKNETDARRFQIAHSWFFEKIDRDPDCEAFQKYNALSREYVKIAAGEKFDGNFMALAIEMMDGDHQGENNAELNQIQSKMAELYEGASRWSDVVRIPISPLPKVRN